MENNNLIIIAILVVLVGGVGFFGGMKYQQSQGSSNTRQNFNGQGRARPGGQLIGTILNQDDNSITVKLNDGSTKIVLLSDSTNINKASQATKSDLAVGTQVGVFGSQNSDGSVTAQNIQLNPVFRGERPMPSPVN